MIFYVGDYDASSWITSVLPHLWNDPARGELPLMWCISPVLERRAPMVLDYVRRTAGPNDYFAAADNGAGYLMPGMLQSPRPVSGLPGGLDVWAGHCRPLYEKWGLTVTGFIIDGEAPALDSRGLACYASFSPDGIVPQKTPRTRLYGEMPVLRAGADLVGTPEESAAFIVEDMRRSPIPFGWYRDILKSPSWHVEVMEHVRPRWSCSTPRPSSSYTAAGCARTPRRRPDKSNRGRGYVSDTMTIRDVHINGHPVLRCLSRLRRQKRYAAPM